MECNNVENKPGQKITVAVDAELKDLIPGFIDEWKEEIRSMQIDLERKNFKTICKVGHDMKGIGTACGFGFVTEMGGRLEEAAKTERHGVIVKTLNRLSTYLAQVEVVYE